MINIIRRHLRFLHLFLTWLISGLVVKTRRNRYTIFLVCGIIAFIVYIGLFLGLICLNILTKSVVDKVCFETVHEHSLGNLCAPICFEDKLTSLKCNKQHNEKTIVFSGQMGNTSYMFKIPQTIYSELPYGPKFDDEYEFLESIKFIAKSKFNIRINSTMAMNITKLDYDPKYLKYSRKLEKENVWHLLNDNEYLAIILYAEYNIFPKLHGTCGILYSMELLNSLGDYINFFKLHDDKVYFKFRVKIALMILKYLERIEALPEPVHFCDIKLSNFGLTVDTDRVKYLDLDAVYPRSVINRKLANGRYCYEHNDCDYLDCRSVCNQATHRCEHGAVNNNLQIVCEKVFLGWTMSRKFLIPGLLVSNHSPGYLTHILEQCANPINESKLPRAKASNDMHERVSKVLKHLFHELSDSSDFFKE